MAATSRHLGNRGYEYAVLLNLPSTIRIYIITYIIVITFIFCDRMKNYMPYISDKVDIGVRRKQFRKPYDLFLQQYLCCILSRNHDGAVLAYELILAVRLTTPYVVESRDLIQGKMKLLSFRRSLPKTRRCCFISP